MRTPPILALLLFAALAVPDEPAGAPIRLPGIVDLKNGICPVTGGKVGKDATVDWNGVRIHVADGDAAKKLAEDPAAALGKLGMNVAGTKEAPIVDLANASCPVMGKPAKEDSFADLDGVRVRFCCPRCPAAFKRAPAKAFEKLGYGYQPPVIDLRNKLCPFTSDATHEGEGAIWADHDGIRVRFCCDECVAKFREDPAATFKKLGVDPEALRRDVK